ncbi:MAG: FtsQ-type POTRA domain-containing protein [Spirochaetaceae bacterium]|jgi:cell division protein FtsQ|nr:FtsQ-type POTRA domain-containing protein [Spirochaetaceae bacterium]
MSGFIYTGAGITRPAKTRDPKVSALKIIMVILIGALVMEVALYFVLIPCFSPVKISYTGTVPYSSEDLNSAVFSSTDSSWIRFDANAACAALANLQGIESVGIEKKFPDKIFVRLTERVPVALSLATYGERTVPVMLDRTGAVFLSAPVFRDDSLPLITGLPLEDIEPGMRLAKKYHPLLGQLESLAKLPEKYFSSFSEIHVENKTAGGYELIVYPVKSRVKILLDRALNEDMLKIVMVTLDVVSAMEPNVEEIDLRYGAFSYRVRPSGARAER